MPDIFQHNSLQILVAEDGCYLIKTKKCLGKLQSKPMGLKLRSRRAPTITLKDQKRAKTSPKSKAQTL